MGILTKFLYASVPVNEGTLTLTDPRFATLFGSLKTFSGLSITPDKAIRCATVVACVRTLTDDVSKMPLQLFEQSSANGRTQKNLALTHPLYPILKDMPNDEMTSMELRAVQMLDMLMWGGFFNQVIRVAGNVSEIYPLSAGFVTTRRDDAGNLVFDYKNPVSGEVTRFNKNQVWRCQMFSFNGIDPYSLMLLVREAIGTLLAAEMQSGRLFSTAAQVNGTLNVPPEVELKPGQDQEVLDNFVNNYSGTGNSMKTALLPFGIKYEKIALTADEAQHIERQKFSAEDIVRAFGGGALMVRLGIGEKNSTFASSMAFLDDYYRSVLTPYTTRIEHTITRDLLDPRERGVFYAKHNHNAILTGDIKSRFEAYGLAIDKGWMSPNKVLDYEDENQVDGLDYYHINPNAIVKDGEIVTVGTTGGGNGPVPPATGAAEAKLRVFAEKSAKRILRAEQKSGKFDAEFVADVLAINLVDAQTYCEKRSSGSLAEADAEAALIALVMES